MDVCTGFGVPNVCHCIRGKMHIHSFQNFHTDYPPQTILLINECPLFLTKHDISSNFTTGL